ncbi:unnamed protein product [Cyclocybe aegerita]|uniref:Gag-like protein n=1 Tax=Cyclocybe aegerita TaxID=1973307 RepID=A0A8S0W4C7_CYCAE|nr:unnamed protein product [Cyclocybe aegerita]
MPTSVAGSSSFGGDASPISPDPTSTEGYLASVTPPQVPFHHGFRPFEMEVEGTQGGEEVSRDPSVDLLLGQYALKFRDTVEDLPGDLEVLTTSIAKATDWVLRAAHHNPLTIDGGDAFVAQMTSFVNAVMATDFKWFEADDLRRITFVYVPSALRWDIHGEAHKYVTELKVRVGRHKTDNSIDALRSRAAHSVLDSWSSTFQDPTYRGSEFLELQQPDGRPLQPSYLNGGPWLSTFGHSITEFARVCRCITGHAPIGAYYRRFKINEPHGCTCGAALQSRQHILFRCRDRYSVHYPRFLGDIASFMKYNPTAFGFNRDPSATDFSRIRGPGELDNFSLASLLEAETSSKDEPTIHPAPVFRPPPPATHGPLDEGVAGVGAPPDVLMQALDDLGRPASPPRIPASKKRKGVDRPVPPPPQKKSKVAYSRPGPPPPINRATKPKPRPTTWAGIAKQAAPMPPPPPGLGPQRRGPSPPPSFPTGPMKTSPHRSVPSFTSEGPTRKQVLVSFGGTPPDLTKFFTESAVRAANGYLRDGRSMLKVTSIVRAYDGLSLVTPAVASPSDLDILRNFIRESLPTGTPFEVALPSSTSFIKILDVPYFDPKGLKITQEALEKALRTSVHAEVFAYLSTKPRIDRNSAHSTSCTVYCNIWDSQQGTRAKKALGQPIFLAGRSCAIRPAARHTGVPLCQRCWKWGHPTVACKAKQLSCPICSGPHEQKEHRQHAGCCKGNAKAKPPVPPTPRDQPCPHKGCCVNCHKDHAANSASCKFWAHRYDREWIMAEYRQTNVGKPAGSK